MITTLLMAIMTYVATSIDEIPVLTMIYMASENKGKGKTITLSYFFGTFLLVAVGLLGGFGLVQLPARWVVGFIGLIPVIMGIKILVDGDDDEEKAMSAAKKINTLWLRVLVITLAMGADDLGVYIPLFTTLNLWEIVEMVFIFAVGTLLLCLISYRLTRIDQLSRFIEKKERYIVGIIFIVIGVMVLIECKTISTIINYICQKGQ